MAVPNIDNLFASTSGLIDKKINQRRLQVPKFWAHAITKTRWMDGNGINPRTIVYEPVHVASPGAWESYALNTGTSSNVVGTPDTVGTAHTIHTYNLQRKILKTNYVALNDIRVAHEFKQQLEAQLISARDNTMAAWVERNRSEYVRLAGRKVILNSSYSEDDAAFPTQLPTTIPTAKILKKFYREIIDLGGATEGGSIKMANGKPQFVVTMSPELQEVLFDDPSLRQDVRESSHSDELLNALGIDRTHGGMYLVADFDAPRWNYSGGWVSVPKWTTEATDEGVRTIRNPAYDTATYEDTIFFLPSVYESQIPAPLSMPGGQTEFNPGNYQGEWKWVNYGHNEDNPFRNHGRFWGELYSASKPINPSVGVVLRGLRPNLVTEFIDANGEVAA